MKQKLQIIFIIFTLLGFSLPVIRFNKKGTVSEIENRTLANKPYIFVDNRLNQNLFNEYNSYFEDRFGGRQRLINFNNSVKHKLNGKSLIYNDRAIQGKKGWCFYISAADGNNLQDFYKRNLLTDEELSDFKTRVQKTVEWCNEQNIVCLFLICPNKHSVYSENYSFNRPKGSPRADQFISIFEEENIPFVFPRDYLISKKEEYDFPIYYETDTHWNSQGAYLASILVKDKIKSLFPAITFPSIEYQTKIENSMTTGDILPMLGIKESKSTIPTVSPVGHNNTDFYTYVRNEGTNGVHTVGLDKKLPRALIFRDSFFSALEQFISPMFSEAEYKWKQFREEDKPYILEYKPDIIIFESVERYAPNIVN